MCFPLNKFKKINGKCWLCVTQEDVDKSNWEWLKKKEQELFKNKKEGKIKMRKVVLLAVMLVTIGSLFAELIPSVDKENALMSLINDSIYRDALYPNTVNIGFRSDIHKMVGRRLFFQLVKFSCKGESGKDFYYEQWFFVRYDEKSQEFVYAGSISDEIFEEAHKCWLIESEKSFYLDYNTRKIIEVEG